MTKDELFVRDVLEDSIKFVAKWAHDHATANDDPHPIGIRQCNRIRKAIEIIERDNHQEPA